MRPLVTKYAGECRKCAAALPVGASVMYERKVGVYCLPCAPTDAEEIRALRQDAADKKADRLDAWAEKREEKASAVLDVGRNHYSRDWAFVTQPGHIPARARWIEKQDREIESLGVAQDMRRRAASLRGGVRVKGDAAAEREAERDGARAWVVVGSRIESAHYGFGTVVKVNRKSVSMKCDGFGGVVKVDLSYIVGRAPEAVSK